MQLLNVTEDKILNGKLKITQPEKGYRAGIEPLFLASAVNARNGDRILDVGMGVGSAMLSLMHRLKNCFCVGVEIQKQFFECVKRNIILNNFKGRSSIYCMDIFNPTWSEKNLSFDHIMTNPPYFLSSQNSPASSLNKQAKHCDKEQMELWLGFCLKMLRPKGSLSIIIRSNWLPFLLNFTSNIIGGVEIFPLFSKKGSPAKIIIFKGIKHSRSAIKLHRGMLLHYKDDYTESAKQIIYQGEGINFNK